MVCMTIVQTLRSKYGGADMRIQALAVAALMLPAFTAAAMAQFMGFAPHVTYGVQNNPQSVAIADLDSDGDRDLAVANSGSNNVSVLINMTDVLPPGAFSLTAPANGVSGLPLPEDYSAWGRRPPSAGRAPSRSPSRPTT